MKDDLNKLEQQWSKRRLFTPAPRRRWPWLLLVVLFVAVGRFLYLSVTP